MCSDSARRPLPLFGAARWAAYRRDSLGDDLVAAVIVTILLVPQSLAYALLAGMPPIVGVMASLLPILAYAAFGSSSTLAVGPVAVLSMMTAQAVAPVAAGPRRRRCIWSRWCWRSRSARCSCSPRCCGSTCFAALLSAPVLHGFIAGAAIVIAIGQLPQLLGVAFGGSTLTEHGALAGARRRSIAPHGPTALIGAAGARPAVGDPPPRRARWPRGSACRRGRAGLAARIAPMLIVVLAIGWIALRRRRHAGVALAGTIDLASGLDFPRAVAGAAGGLAGAARARRCCSGWSPTSRAWRWPRRSPRGAARRINARRELFGLAAANVAASVAGGMPVTGGFARSIVNFDAGARTRMAGVWTVLFLGHRGIRCSATSLALAAEGRACRDDHDRGAVAGRSAIRSVQAWRYARLEFALMLLVAVLTITVGVEAALLAGVVVAAGLLLQRTARPHWAEVGRLRGTEVFRNVKRFKVDTLPDVMAIRIDESLLFTNSRWLADTAGQRAAARGPG